MWPVNLVRDFPVRFGRLCATLGHGVAGVVRFLPEASREVGRGRLWPGLWLTLGRGLSWAHLFVVQLFDLYGGPEIAQFWMRLFTNTTPLSGEEIAVISSILGPNAMRYGEVRVAEGGVLDVVFKYNGNLAFATWRTINLPKDGRHTRANLPVVVHELIHVYQYECVGSRYLGEAIYTLVKTKRDCYDYGSVAGLQAATEQGRRFRDYNREQQAMISQDYYTRGQAGKDVSAFEPFISQLRAGEL
jgi:hypothetical protein